MTSTLFGQLAAHTLRSSDQQTHLAQAQSDLIALINEHIHPPTPLTLDDVHIRAMRLVSDEVNDHGGRFPREEHERLCELVIDSPVLIGHDRSHLPVARNFAARCVDEGERRWVEVWFYWLRGDGPHHDQLAADIDAGVVKEGSIGFEFALPQCSICGEDIRTCEHIPGFEYEGQTAHYEYRNIIRVLETSLVYRGATPNTRIVNYPLFAKLGSLTRPARLSAAGRPVPEGEANKPKPLLIHGLKILEHGDPSSPSRSSICSPLPLGEVALRSESVAERVREPVATPHAPPTLLRVFLTSRRELRSFHCPARTVLWPRYVREYKAGHGPLTLSVRRRVLR